MTKPAAPTRKDRLYLFERTLRDGAEAHGVDHSPEGKLHRGCPALRIRP